MGEIRSAFASSDHLDMLLEMKQPLGYVGVSVISHLVITFSRTYM